MNWAATERQPNEARRLTSGESNLDQGGVCGGEALPSDSGNVLKIKPNSFSGKGSAERKEDSKPDAKNSVWGNLSTCTAPVEPE